MEVKPGYKQTEVGAIPEDWEVKSLGDIGEALIGLTYKPTEVRNYGTLVLRSSNIQNDALEFENNVFVDAEISERIMVRPNDVLICVRNGSRDLIGKSALLDERANGMTFGAFMAVYRSQIGRLASYLFQSDILKRQINEHLGATINQITNKSLNSFRIPLSPSVFEQCTIANALSDMDALLVGLDRLIAKKRTIKKATMQQLLTGQSRLPGFSGEWNVKLLGDVAEVKTGPFGSLLHERDYVSDGVPIITVEHLGEFGVEHVNLPMVSEADCKRLNAYSLHVGDIVFSRVGSVDRNALIRKLEDGWLFSGRLLRVRPNESCINSMFLSYQFHSEKFKLAVRTVAVGQTMASLNTRILNGIQVNLPSISEQTAIATILSDMDAEITVLETRRIKTRALKQAMMQELLTGRTRLI
ncbi:restriction endonuclease subunit S [Xanthomonas campestris]|uniref:restriction endonuclease subunit S n=1 Tax=Xanthomonas campestris TaxID=339 RepID=UPI003CE70E87